MRQTLKSRLASVVGLEGVNEGRTEVADPPDVVEATKDAAEYDPLRDGPLRYCGYFNELGCATPFDPTCHGPFPCRGCLHAAGKVTVAWDTLLGDVMLLLCSVLQCASYCSRLVLCLA